MSSGHMIVSGAFGRIDVPKIDKISYSYSNQTNRWTGSILIDEEQNPYVFDMAAAGYKNSTLYIFESKNKQSMVFRFKSVDLFLPNGLYIRSHIIPTDSFIEFSSPTRLTI